jgi:hypothetical protein
MVGILLGLQISGDSLGVELGRHHVPAVPVFAVHVWL